MRPTYTAYTFGMKYCLLIPYIKPPGVQTAHAPGIKTFHKLIMGKTLKIFFSETMRPTCSAFIFGMKHFLVVHCTNPVKQAPGGPNWPHPGNQEFP